MHRAKYLLGLVLALSATAGSAQQVMTAAGAVEGERLGAVVRYLGVPFAAPPVGELRWRAPRDPQPWSGTYSATAAKPACAQVGNFFASNDPATFDLPYGSEDCLYLNVWAPADRAGPRPVLLFIHGGSGVAGSGSYPLYDSARLAAETGAVVVTTNYRLGLFGAIHLPALRSGDPAEDSGSFFLLDLIKSLDWIQQNIGGFGGDPGNVTISGQSAGAVSVFALLRSPLARGKFHKAISLSGLPFSSSMDAALLRTDGFLIRLMLGDGSIAAPAALAQRKSDLGEAGLREYLRGKRADEIVQASIDQFGVPYVADGAVLPAVERPDEQVPQLLSPVPVMMGKVRNEASMLLLPRYTHLDQRGLWALLSGGGTVPTRADFFGGFRYLAYRTLNWFAERGINGQIESLSDRIAAQAPAVYRYEFDWDGVPQPWLRLFGVFHGVDLPFLFGNFIDDRPTFGGFAWTPDNAQARVALHLRMAADLRGFLETGDPNAYGDRSGPAWRPWDAQRYTRRWGGAETAAGGR